MSNPPRRGIWWLSPVGVISLISLPTLLLAARTSDAGYRFAWGTPKALTEQTAVLVLSGALAFMLCASLPMLARPSASSSRWPDFSAAQNRLLERAAGPLFWLTIAGYVAFAVSGFRNGLRPSSVLQAIAGQNVYGGGIREELGRVAGVTSLTQVGVAFVIVAMLILVQNGDRRLRRRLITIMLLAVLRASLGERLAILELLIPAIAIVALRQTGAGRSRGRVIAAFAPAVLIPMVLVMFGAFEYSRSWVFYSSRTSSSYGQFVIQRFAGYYATAYNNGQLALNYETYPGRAPFDSVQALWTVPGASLYGGYPAPVGFDPPGAEFRDLQLHGNPEFNSPGGLVIPFIDWGENGGLLYLAGSGALIGLLYRRCLDGHPLAVVLYPSVTTGLFELPRYIYWVTGRYVPSLVALSLLGYFLVRTARSSEPSAVAIASTPDPLR